MFLHSDSILTILQHFEKNEFYPFNRLLVPKLEKTGFRFDPINIDLYLQLKAINEVKGVVDKKITLCYYSSSVEVALCIVNDFMMTGCSRTQTFIP